MNQILEPDVVITLPAESGKKFTGIAFDCHFFYMALPQEHKICQFNQEFILVNCFQVNRPYHTICYDGRERCFWAAQDKQNRVIYRLDGNMRETGFLELCNCIPSESQITGISCNWDNSSLYVSFTDYTAEFSQGGELIRSLQKTNDGRYTGVLSIPPYFALIRACKHAQWLQIFSDRNQLMFNLNIPDGYHIEGILFDASNIKQMGCISLIFLAGDRYSSPCILKCSIERNDILLSPVNFICCTEKCDSADELLTSIAMMEAALSHILNAEGEKLQKAVAVAENICDLLKMNEAVNKTIERVTLLEQVLYLKLEAVNSLEPGGNCDKCCDNCCDDCCDKCCDKCCDNCCGKCCDKCCDICCDKSN